MSSCIILHCDELVRILIFALLVQFYFLFDMNEIVNTTRHNVNACFRYILGRVIAHIIA